MLTFVSIRNDNGMNMIIRCQSPGNVAAGIINGGILQSHQNRAQMVSYARPMQSRHQQSTASLQSGTPMSAHTVVSQPVPQPIPKLVPQSVNQQTPKVASTRTGPYTQPQASPTSNSSKPPSLTPAKKCVPKENLPKFRPSKTPAPKEKRTPKPGKVKSEIIPKGVSERVANFQKIEITI